MYGNGIRNPAPFAALTNLQTLGLSSNPLGNCGGLVGFTNLTTLYLSSASLTNADGLAGLRKLTSLVLSDNPITHYGAVAGLTNLQSLYLDGNSISNLGFVLALTQLRYLDLHQNRLSDLSAVAGLTNLTTLSLGYNPITNYAAVAGLTNLQSLYLDGNLICNLGFAQGLTQLRYLHLYQNRLSDLSAVAGLTNLSYLDASYGQMTNINSLTNFAHLSSINLGNNLLDLTPGSATMNVIQYLQDRGTAVYYQPQVTNQPPTISLPAAWAIAADSTSMLNFWVWDDLTPAGELAVFASSSNTGLVSSTGIVLGGANQARTLTVTPVANQTGATTITLTVTDDLGVSTHASTVVTVVLLTNVVFADPNLEAAIREALNKPTNAVTTLDLLSLTCLYAGYRNITNLSGIENALNLTTLYLDYNSISNVAALAGLTRLNFLILYGNRVNDGAPLAGLTNLQGLFLDWNPLGSCAGFASLTNLESLAIGYTSTTNPACVMGLTRLSYLGLNGNDITDPTPFTALTNLQTLNLSGNPLGNCDGLAGFTNLTALYLSSASLTNADGLAGLRKLTLLYLSYNPITNYAAVASLTNLQSLYLQGNSISNLGVVQRLTQLGYLYVGQNRLSDLSGAEGLTNLYGLDASYGRLTNINVLTNLAHLSWVYLGNNFLDLTPDSAAMNVIQYLQGHGVTVSYQPQMTNQAPTISLPAAWTVATNSTSTLNFSVWDDLTPAGELAVFARSSNTGLLSGAGIVLGGASEARTLTVTPVVNQTGATTIILAVTDEMGLTTHASMVVTVVEVTNVVFADANLEAAIREALNKPTSAITTSDLLSLSYLSTGYRNITSLRGLENALNLTMLDLQGNAISNVAPLAGLINLQSLFLNNNSISDIAPLAGLTNLQSLYLDSNPLVSCAGFASLTNLVSLSIAYASTTNPACVTGLGRLTSLQTLNLSGNPLGNCDGLAGFTNLTALYLDSTSLTNADGLAGLVRLNALSLSYNLLGDLDWLSRLTSLYNLNAYGNRLTNIMALEGLLMSPWPGRSQVSLGRNLLDLNPGSAAMNVITNLQYQGVNVDYQPQNEPPTFAVASNWIIAANSTSTLRFYLWDDVTAADQLLITASSSNTGLVPNEAIALSFMEPGPYPYGGAYGPSPLRSLTVTPAVNQTGTTMITLATTDGTKLSTNATILVNVVMPTPFDGGSLNNSNLVWRSLGSSPWFGQTNASHDGAAAAQSGSADSCLEATITGPGTLTFWWKASPQTNGGGGEFIACRAVSGLSGELQVGAGAGWRKEIVSLPAGLWVLRWSPRADPYSGGSPPTVWVDEVSFVPGPSVCWLEAAKSVYGYGWFGPCADLTLHGQPGGTYDLETSSNLQDWSVLYRGLWLDNFQMSYWDWSASQGSRFYRLRKVAVATPLLLEAGGMVGNGQFQLVLHGEPGQVCEVLVSTNLTTWTGVGRVTNTLGIVTWTDTAATNSLRRFYRATGLP